MAIMVKLTDANGAAPPASGPLLDTEKWSFPMPRQYRTRTRATCLICQEDFPTYPNRVARGEAKYCSRRCQATSKRTHGEGRGPTKSAEYMAWSSMKSRCLKPATKGYHWYGGRGITVCDAWQDSYDAFLQDMGRRPSPKHSLDRINPNGDYEPTNCRWATWTEQARNRRDNHVLALNGISRLLVEWSELLGISRMVIRARLRKGWSVERTLTTPLKQRAMP